MKLNKLAIFVIAALVAGVATAATLKSDITSQGVESYFGKSVTDQQLATMIRDYETVAAANTLAYTECGKISFLAAAGAVASTLPDPIAGCSFKFVITSSPTSGNYTVLTSGGSNIIIGGVNELEVDTGDDGPAALIGDPMDTVTFNSNTAVAGDYIECVSDGTYWMCNGQTNVDGGLSFSSS